MLKDMGLFSNAFYGRRVLVTGHTGFKGSWLTFWLQAMGASVAGYALEPPTEPSLFEELGLGDSMAAHVIGDVRESDSLKGAMARHQPEMVFHLAAQPLVRYGYAEPRLTYETNVMGTVNLFEAVRQTPGARVVLNITSDKCYENREWDYAYRENDPMGGYDPYSSSKGCAELVTAAYRNSFMREAGVRLASVRAGNVIGGGDWAQDRIIPDCIRALSGGEEIQVRNPAAIRPWQHVLEPLSGYLWLASRLWQGKDGLDAMLDEGFDDAWNFGPEPASNIPVKDVVEAVIGEWSSGSWRGPDGTIPQPHEAKSLMLDWTKANRILGWRPVYGIGRALQVTTSWYKAFYEGEEAAQITTGDIKDYVQEAVRQQIAWAEILEVEAT